MRRNPAVFIAVALIAANLAPARVRAEDRYGPAPAAASPALAPGETLSWPGKQPAPTIATLAPAPINPPARVQPARTQAANLYSPRPAPPIAAAQPGAQAGGQPPRFYSLHRQYGVEPDPIVLSPQFLAASGSADLAEPPPLPPHTAAQTANMSAAAANAVNRQASEAQQSDGTAN